MAASKRVDVTIVKIEEQYGRNYCNETNHTPHLLATYGVYIRLIVYKSYNDFIHTLARNLKYYSLTLLYPYNS